MSDFRLPLIALALLPLVGACGDDDDPSGPATSFSATLTGGEEVPAVVTSATGNATLDVSGSAITYTVTVSGLANPIVSHIHIAPVGENGPVRLNLCGTTDTPACATGDGVLVTGTNGATVGAPAITFDELVEAIRAGNAYVNVHTDDGIGQPNTGAGDMQSGEIRGQIVAD
jgi:hypothetical protein